MRTGYGFNLPKIKLIILALNFDAYLVVKNKNYSTKITVAFVFCSIIEKDYPPVARAGNDVVIVLPVDHVTLYGNGSTDDKVHVLHLYVNR